MNREAFTILLGKTANSYVHLLNEMCTLLSKQNYEYPHTDNQKFENLLKEGKISRAMNVYWIEILQCAHFGAVAGLLRQQRWLKGMIDSSISGNFICFSSCFRGLIESAGDTFDVFQYVPLTLARCFSHISQALNCKLDEVVISEELENKLIHFSHARRVERGETAPDSHKAKTSKNYVEAINIGNTQILRCYSELCQIVHPAASSINCFLVPTSEDTWAYADKIDDISIEDFMKRYQTIFPNLFMLPINSCILTLQLLNQFNHGTVRTPIPTWFNMKSVPAWQKVEKVIKEEKSVRSPH